MKICVYNKFVAVKRSCATCDIFFREYFSPDNFDLIARDIVDMEVLLAPTFCIMS